MEHTFEGRWISDGEFYDLEPRNVFHRQLEQTSLSCEAHRDRHVLFRKKFVIKSSFDNAILYISADDYYKLYINGKFIGQGPAPSYHFAYNYNVIDVGSYLKEGENIIALHTLYQGLINRVWQSADNRHGAILDLVIDGECILSSDESFLTHPHTAYTETGVCGYDTQFLESYDSLAREVGFEKPNFDDSYWQSAKLCRYDDRQMKEQKTAMLEFEKIRPVFITKRGQSVIYDFDAVYVGYLCVSVRGDKGQSVIIRCAQELSDDSSLRFKLRANCTYEEEWQLGKGVSVLDQFDYKSFRYAEIILPEGAEIADIYLLSRHFPFSLKATPRHDIRKSDDLMRVWELCTNSQRYGVQEVIQDCMEREKGFYLGDGCYTALANMILTGDDLMVRKLIDDAFSTSFITDTLVTCMCCSFIQEIAEYPLILIYLVLWHYNFTGDKEYLCDNYEKVTKLLDAYKREYEKDHLLCNLDKWCVVEWPHNFRHGYDVDLREGKICKSAHVSINAYYISAAEHANKMAKILDKKPYRDCTPLFNAFDKAFFDTESGLYKDSAESSHISLVGNTFVWGFGLSKDESFKKNFVSLFEKHGISSLSMFCTFPFLMGAVREGRDDLVLNALSDENAWLRTLREGGKTTFEGFGKDTKWNTSLFHLTLSYASVFMADTDLRHLFGFDG